MKSIVNGILNEVKNKIKTEPICKPRWTLVRKVANQPGSPYPVKVILGNSPPIVSGESCHYTNKSGDLIRHPNAYKWPMVYHYSTLQIKVGEDWLQVNDPENWRRWKLASTLSA